MTLVLLFAVLLAAFLYGLAAGFVWGHDRAIRQVREIEALFQERYEGSNE
jgi:hypothetical protein